MLKSTLNILLSFTLMYSLSACSETKEVKVEHNTVASSTPISEAEEDVNVNVHVDQPNAQVPVTRDTTNVVVKNEESAKEVALMNANIQKLQNQLATANAQSKAEINKQIQQMNADKAKLQAQIADLQNQNKMAQDQMRKAEAEKIANENLSVTKEQYKDTASTKLENFDTKLTQLRDKTASLSDADKTSVENEITKLEDKRSEIETKISDIDTASNINSFKTIRTQIDSMMTDLDKKYNNLISTRISLR